MKPRYVRCVITDAPVEYKGYGRPPKYVSDAARKAADAKRRKERRAKEREARKAAPL